MSGAPLHPMATSNFDALHAREPSGATLSRMSRSNCQIGLSPCPLDVDVGATASESQSPRLS